MFGWLKAKKVRRDRASLLYKLCVTQARLPVFYQDLKVPDTMEGRFEMICLHVSLLLHFLYSVDEKDLAQDIFDVMFIDIDYNLREEGVGDLAVPKRIKKMMKALKGRTVAYQEGLHSQQLEIAIERNIGTQEPYIISYFVHYIELSQNHIKTVGGANFKDPQTLFLSLEQMDNIKSLLGSNSVLQKQTIA